MAKKAGFQAAPRDRGTDVDRRLVLCGAAAVLTACSAPIRPDDEAQRASAASDKTALPSFAEAFDDRMGDVLAPSAVLETLATGYGWGEGPTWDRARARLYYTDVPGNVAYQWSREKGAAPFLDPSGPTGLSGFREPGANGLWYTDDDRLLICNHGARAVERMDLATGERSVLADRYGGEPFNSPNDVIQATDGLIYFTDPPYGLEGGDESPLKRQSANGVYRLTPDGVVMRLLSDMTRPNGVALSPDERTLYVTQSEADRPILRALTLGDDGAVIGDRVLADFTALMGPDTPGLPDGMAVAASGEVLVGGPGGVIVVAPDGVFLGRIGTGRATANCCFGEDGRTLFMTAHDRLMAVRTRLLGVQWS